MKITLAQKEQIVTLFNTPSSQLSTESMMGQIETDMGITVPRDLWSEFFESGFGLTLRNRPRKNVPVAKEIKPKKEVKKVFTFEFEAADGKVEEVTLVRGKKSEDVEEPQESETLPAEPSQGLRPEVEDIAVENVVEDTAQVEEIQEFGNELNSSFQNLIADDNQ
jgi:hypothetical protein